MMIQKELLPIEKKNILNWCTSSICIGGIFQFFFHQKRKDRNDTLTQLEFKN